MKVAITGDPTSAFVFHIEGLVTDHMGFKTAPWLVCTCAACKHLAALFHLNWTWLQPYKETGHPGGPQVGGRRRERCFGALCTQSRFPSFASLT